MSTAGGTTYAPPPTEGSQTQTPSIPPVQIVIIAIVIFGTIAIISGISLCCRKKRQREAQRHRPETTTSTQHLRTNSSGQLQYEDWIRIAMGLQQQNRTERAETPPRSRGRAGQMMRSLSRRALRRSDSVRSVEDPPPRYEQALKDKTVPQGHAGQLGLAGAGADAPVGLAIDMPCEAVSPISDRSSTESERGRAVGLGVAM